jgi:hypothetical protein
VSVYGAAPTTRAPIFIDSIINSSVPGLLVNPSCGNTQTSASIAHL